MVKQLLPWKGNTKKRLVKAPKVYLSDTGIAAALLQLPTFEQIAGHPVIGSLWESTVIANVLEQFPGIEFSYYRTSHGHEIDLLLTFQQRTVAVECKATIAPSLSKGFYKAAEDINPEHIFIAAPVEQGYSMKKNIDIVSISELIQKIEKHFFQS